jgi:putative ABC transport system substrate-binding protein
LIGGDPYATVKPSTNVTGTTAYAPQLVSERLQTLKQMPTADKVAMALNGNNANNAAQFELLRSEAQKLDMAVESLDIRKPEDVDAHLTGPWHSEPIGS